MNASMFLRTLRVLGLWLGFYALGLGVSAVLFALPIMQLRYEQLGWSGALCGVLGLWMLLALIPRRLRAREPGTPLPPGSHPRLEALVRELAARVGQPAPRRIYLVPEATAFAGRAPKWFGFRSDPIVGIGLPLFELLDVAELEAVLAHEFGHHWGGDVRLGPWVRRTHLAIAQALDRFEGSSVWLHLPFVLYGNFFLRTASQASRGQELAADALAAKLCGSQAIASALRRIEASASLWTMYCRHELLPILDQKCVPPLWTGFRIYRDQLTGRPEWREEVERSAARKTSELDTHPVLADRLAALGEPAEPPDTRPDTCDEEHHSWELLASREAAERHVLADLLVDRDPSALRATAWSEVAERVWLPQWRRASAEFPALAQLQLEQLPAVFAPASPWPEKLRSGLALLSPAAQRKQHVRLLSHWLSVRLFDAGYALETLPGAQVRLARGELSLEPHVVVDKLASGGMSQADWLALCARITAA